jgi:hypothetical protein
MMLLAALLAAAAPQPSILKTFGDWTVGCDNGRACQAVALLSEEEQDGATLAVQRGAEAEAAPAIWVTIRSEGVESPEYLEVDGRRCALALDPASQTLQVRDGAECGRLLGQATRINALDRSGRVLAKVSTKGSAAALLSMDEQQRRLDTVAALVRRGPKAASLVPAPPALPLVRKPAASSKPARKLTADQVRRMLGKDATVCEYPNDLSIEGGRLDARHSLVLASHPCGNGAYNYYYSAWVIDERGRARRAPLDVSRGIGEYDDALVNAGWDAAGRRLTSFFKGRGVGDCGSGQEFAWDGTRFRLVRAEAMGECRGSTDYITTWRAEVR